MTLGYTKMLKKVTLGYTKMLKKVPLQILASLLIKYYKSPLPGRQAF